MFRRGRGKKGPLSRGGRYRRRKSPDRRRGGPGQGRGQGESRHRPGERAGERAEKPPERRRCKIDLYPLLQIVFMEKRKKEGRFRPKASQMGLRGPCRRRRKGAAASASAADRSKKDEKISWKEKIACRLPNIVMYISILPKPRGKVHKFVKIGLDDFRALLHLKAGNGGCKMPM